MAIALLRNELLGLELELLRWELLLRHELMQMHWLGLELKLLWELLLWDLLRP